MDLGEATRRIFLVHRKLIFLCVALGLIGGLALTAVRPAKFTAGTRLVLGVEGARTSDGAVSAADAAEALVTSRAIVEQAVRTAGVDLDPLDVASESISVKTLGSSDLVQLEVTDPDPVVAAKLANALGQELVNRWGEVSGGQSIAALVPLQDEIRLLRDGLTTADQKLALLDTKIAGETDPAEEQRLNALSDALSQRRDELEQRRLLLESQLTGVLVDGASRQEPQVIDPAVPPTLPDPKQAQSIAALGALLGLLVGVSLAALIESFRPTLAGSDAVADALGVPMLGKMPTGVEGSPEIRRSALKVRLAATGVHAKTVQLASIGPSIDLSPLSDAVEELNATAGSDTPSATGSNGRLAVRRFGVDLEAPRRSSGTNGINGTNGTNRTNRKTESALVAIVPSTIKRADLRELGDLQALTAWPLVGVVTYDRSARARRHPQPAQELGSSDEGDRDLPQRAG